MLTYMLVLCVLAYFIIGFLSYSEYKSKYGNKPMKFDKAFYLCFSLVMYIAIGGFLGVLGYLILTM